MNARTSPAHTFHFYAHSPIRNWAPLSLLNPTTTRRSSTSAAASIVTATAPAQPSPARNRRLILLRHAQSSWEDRSLRDHDRPLSKAGEIDAAKVSQKLHVLGWIPQLILCSDARRTRETLRLMQKEVIDFLEAEVRFLSSFYSVAAMDGQTAEHLQRCICEYSGDDISTIMCMGHNKGWEEAATMFSGESVELKTCNAALLEGYGESWAEAFSLAGLGGWKLYGVVKPETGFSGDTLLSC